MAEVAIVVGGGTGMGRASAERLVRRGLAVMLSGRRADVLEAAKKELESAHPGASVAAYPADSAVLAEARAMVEATVAAFGRVDICVNCAGTYEPTDFLDFDEASWRGGVGPCLDAMAYPSVAAARVMAAGGGGRFVLISSICAVLSEPDASHYNAAKAGVSGLTRSMALDLAKHKILVNAVAPGWINTEMAQAGMKNAPTPDFTRVNPLARMGEPDEIANVVEYLALDSPEFLNGETVFVDGGQTGMAQMP